MTDYCKHNLPREECEECSPEQRNLFDLDEGKRLRDEGIGRVHREGFTAAVSKVLDTMVGRRVKGENIRDECIRRGVEPHHHNAWGGVINGFVKQGRLRFTGEFTPAASVKTRAHPVKIYEVVC
jgi:hypothetical protein